MTFLLQDTGLDQNFFALNFLSVLCFRELGRAKASSPQMLYMYVNDILFLTKNWMGRELLCPKFFYACK